MRFVWAVAAFVLAALMIGAGIAQRTIFEGPKSQSQAIEVAGDAPYVLIDGSVLTSHDGSQNLRVQGDGTIFAAYARTADMKAWLARADYTEVGVDDGAITSSSIAAADPPAADAAPLTPVGSDLWLDEFQQKDVLITPLQLPADMSLLVATDGVEPAPRSLSLTWPVRSSTPWAGPLIVGGSILLVVGLVLYVLGVRHARRSRGPRRKGVPLPVTEPIDLSVEGSEKGVISATPARRRLTRGKKSFVALPLVAAGALLITGCTPDAWPQPAASPTPSASASVVVPDDQGSPVVTETQAERIVGRISTAVAAADEARDATAASVRLAGTALAVRETNYTLRGAIADEPAVPAIPSGDLQVILPEANDEWPRTFFAVAAGGTEGDAESADQILSVSQQDPWSPYQLTSIATLTSDTELNLAPAYVGAIPIPADSPFLAIAPDGLAAAYADVLTKGTGSEYAALFDSADDAFQAQLDANRTQRLNDFNQTGAQTGSLTFAATAGTQKPVALATLDSGAIVAVTVDDIDTVVPTNTDAVIKVDNNPIVQTLTGVTQSATGFTTTYANQLFFFVPSQSSKERISLLGYSSNILQSKVVG
ncbi:glycosyl transferase [Microbacterium sp. F2E]|uniref:glycosyl transferase n=1 Tax=Microbacterium TaxID=33882 RepID=UPI001E5E8FAC|nr:MULTISPECIES: glycosyl transferase [Microbacterium]MCC9055062.1 glycosyl transferase [Microbacterium sp. F2E]